MGLRVADIEPDANPLGEGVERGQRRSRVDLGPPVGGDRQGASGEVDVGLRLSDQPSEARAIGRANGLVVDHGSDGSAGREAAQAVVDGSPGRSAIPWPSAMLGNPYRFGRICARRNL